MTFSRLLFCAFASALMGGLTVAIWNRTPPTWLWEDRQSPEEKAALIPLSLRPWGPLFSIVYMACAICMGLHCHEPAHPAVLLIVFALFQLSIADVKFHVLQDQWIALAGVGGLLVSAGHVEGPAAAVGAALPFAIFAAVAAAAAAAHRPLPVGFGDVKLFSALGLSLGAGAIIRIWAVATLICGVAAAYLLLTGAKNKKDQIAFGPFIAISTVFYLLS